MTLVFPVAGLTAGRSYSFDLLFSSPDGATVELLALGETGVTPGSTSGGPIVMTVQAV